MSLWRRASAADARSRSRRFGAPPAGRQQASKATTTTRRLFRCAPGARPLEAVHGRAPSGNHRSCDRTGHIACYNPDGRVDRRGRVHRAARVELSRIHPEAGCRLSALVADERGHALECAWRFEYRAQRPLDLEGAVVGAQSFPNEFDETRRADRLAVVVAAQKAADNKAEEIVGRADHPTAGARQGTGWASSSHKERTLMPARA